MRKLLVPLLAIVLALGLSLPVTMPVRAQTTWYVNPGESIQAAVDGASWGDTIILNDGTFSNYLTVTVATSGITIKAANPGQAILDGGGGPAFRLANGLSDVTFEGLVIQNRTGWRGGGIEAWDRTTSNIRVLNNQFLNNAYSAILVGSEGGYIHTNWAVHSNKVVIPTAPTSPNWFALGIELTNTTSSSIARNEVSGGHIGILVQARNTIPGSGVVVIEGVNVNNNKVFGVALSAYGYGVGVYVLSLASGPVSPWDPITAAQSNLGGVTLNGNNIEAEARGVYVLGYQAGEVSDLSLVRNQVESEIVGAYLVGYGAQGKVTNASLVRNTIVGPGPDPDPPVTKGIWLRQFDGGQVTNTKLVNNTITDWDVPVDDGGEDTKTPPGPP